MSLNSMRLFTREEFQLWLFRDEDIRTELDGVIGASLNSDANSLDDLEAFILDRFSTADEMFSLENRSLTDALARHIGLVFVLNVDDARWDIDLDDDDNAYYMLPVVILGNGTVGCPLTMASTAAARRSGTFLGDLFDSLTGDVEP